MDTAILDVEHILRTTLDVIRRDAWKPNAWGLVPPWCLRRALNHVVEQTHKFARERDEANAAARQAISTAIGQPLGLIMSWEAEKGRAQADIENILEKAIAGVTG